jgi:hypothetical protein
VSAFSSRDVEAAGELAVARLDDDGAPPLATWPQAGDSHDRDTIRRAFAFSHDRLLADVAEDVVARRLRLG